MSLENTLKEACDGLRSNRATERKKNGEILKEFLSRNAVPSLLKENTLNKRGYTWSDLFDDINDYVMKELEKYETLKTFDNIIGPLLASLLNLCVSGANKGEAYIKCEKIMDACLIILKDNRLSKGIGDAYFTMLYRHVLPYQHYMECITPTTWEELLEVCISACTTNISKLDDFTKLRIVLLVMKNGKNNCQFVVPLRDALHKLKKCFLKLENDKKVQEVIMDITILLLETLSAESRLTMCQFSEEILPLVLKFYTQSVDRKKKILLFKLLNGVLLLHHPKGRLQKEEGSLAKDWEIWNNHLNNISEIVSLEVVYLQKNRKQNDMSLKVNDDFYTLAANVYFQVLSRSSELADDENLPKRPRLSFNNIKTFSDIIDELKQNYIPWLGIINIYLVKFGNSLSDRDYLLLLTYTESIVTKNPLDYIWDIFESFTTYILKNLKTHFSSMKMAYETVLTALWNSCVRNSTLNNMAHSAVHKMMRLLISLEFLDYTKVQPLMKLYYDKGMPITDSSIRTLNIIFHKFFSKCCANQSRINLFKWFIEGEIDSIEVSRLKEFISRLMANDNINFIESDKSDKCPYLHNVMFNSIEDCVLFSEFESELPTFPTDVDNKIEDIININIDIDNQIQIYLKESLKTFVTKLEKNEIDFVKYAKFLNLILLYLDTLLKYSVETRSDIKSMEIYCILKHSLRIMCQKLHLVLKSDAQIVVKIRSLDIVTQFLKHNYDIVLNTDLRSCFYEDLFKYINRILTSENVNEDYDVIEQNEDDINNNTLKHNCIYLLAAFCRKKDDYRDDIIDFILDPKCYNFKSDFRCVLNCVELLLDANVEQPPFDLILTLIQSMCKNLYRDSVASYGILSILKRILDNIDFLEDNKRQNCYIMVKSYLLRCKQMYYPPKVVGLILECGIKIAALHRRDKCHFDSTDIFEETVIDKIKGDTQSIRVYASYLLKDLFEAYSEDDVEMFQRNLSDIFLVDVSGKREVILKDEAANRTLAVLHALRALAETKRSLMQKHITAILKLQKEKSLDKNLLKKVLNIIITKTEQQDVKTYLNKNIISILCYWYTNGMSIEELPVYLFGCDDLKCFIEKHLHWLLPAEVIWAVKGNIQESKILKQAMQTTGHSMDTIIQKNFNHLILMCMPYKVVEKYHLDYTGYESLTSFKKSTEYANKMFQQTCQILKNDTWNNLFIENIGELVSLSALNLCDSEETRKQFKANIAGTPKYYFYTKSVFTAILHFFAECTEENIMEYLCENHSITIFKTLFRLWQNVLIEKVFKLKVLALNAYMIFVDNIPFGYTSDAFIFNFVCKSFVEVLKECKNREEIKVYAQGLKTVLEKMFRSKLGFARKNIDQLLPILVLKKEEGFGIECEPLLNYLLDDMKDYLNESLDVVDFVRCLSQGRVANLENSSLTKFIDQFRIYKTNLSCPSHETLMNLKDFLKVNKSFVTILYANLDSKGFSEECGTSLIHEMIYLLNNILKTATDEKTIAEACNCLSELGTYDLKSLITIPPSKVHKIVDINPNTYFIGTVIKCLTEVLFGEDPIITEEVAQALNVFLKYFQDIEQLDIETLDKQILKPLSSLSDHMQFEVNVNDRTFDEYCKRYEKGIFVEYLIENISNDDAINECNWLKQVTSTLLQLFNSTSDCFNILKQVCDSKAIICEKILPSLVGMLVYCSSESQMCSFSEQVNNFFNSVWEQTFHNNVQFNNIPERPNSVISTRHCNKMIIQNMLQVIDFLRLQKKYYKQRPGRKAECHNYLNLDYDKVAWAASVADKHLVALYYGELWALSQNDGVPPSSPEATANLPNGENVLQLFRKCYVSIGELDALDGCGTSHLTIEKEKREHLINTSQFSDALLLHDIALSCEQNGDPSLQFGVVRSLHKSGMHHLALQYIKSLPESDELNEIKYDCLSYLGDWSDFVDVKEIKEKSQQINCNNNYILKAMHYACLKESFMISGTSGDNKKIEQILNQTKLTVSRLCMKLNMENCQNVYKIVGKLHLLTDIEKFSSIRTRVITIEELINHWKIDKLPQYKDFKHLEALISQRVLILENVAKSYEDYTKEIMCLQLQYAKLALSNDRIQMAQRLLAIAKKVRLSDEVVLVDSEISWAKGHKDIAISLVRNILKNGQTDPDLFAKSLRKYALWIAESKRDNPRDIINKYLLKSLNGLNESENVSTRLKVYYDIAKFADAEYKQVVTYMKSSVFEHKVKCMEKMKGTASTLKSTQLSLTRDERKALFVNDRFGELDEAEIANTKMEKECFLLLAMRYYLFSLEQCEDNNLSIFRIISLWLDNPCFEFDKNEDQKTFKDLLDAIPSRKFITVLPQLVPHLSDESSDFALYLKDIIKRCALEHPHHTLPIVFSLKNSEKDKIILNESGNIGGRQKPRTQDPLAVAAGALVRELQNSQLAKIIHQMEELCDATISFANYKPQNKNINKQSIPSAENICKLRNLDAIPVPTATIAVRSDCDYSSISTIQSFDSHFELVGGINCPKKVFCTDSFGSKKILLVKGEDDLRQDAVMQQVFNIVNTLLDKNPVTSRNNLTIRTYKVVPMSRQSGVLEWCVGTIPLGLYLGGNNNTGAHARYRPQDITCRAAREQLIKCHQAKEKTSNKEKLRVFQKILSEFKPVFHYFFTEHYLDPVTWYERRLAYTKSVATSSMVGYILGLGDRHVQNILIDKRTAEVIHIDFVTRFPSPLREQQRICGTFGVAKAESTQRSLEADFDENYSGIVRCLKNKLPLSEFKSIDFLEEMSKGIAFDQGKTLHTPETVPFRLTQDMIAGFGASGVEGLFKRCCEKTMRLLRDNQETLLTILEVLLCDPLYSWRVETTQQNASTSNKDTTLNCPAGSRSSLAERALLSVSSKLSGTEAEGGAAGGVAVPGQVARLLRSAADHGNLCRLFPGWQPYL